MKNHTELTNAELLALTPQGIADLIDFECAVAGIPLLPSFPVKPVKPAFVKDVTLYNVSGLHFIDETEAMNVMKVLLDCNLVDTNGWGDTTRTCELSEYNKPKVETTQVYSQEQYSRIEQDIKYFNKLEDDYNQEMSEYNRILKLREEIAAEIQNKVDDLQLREARKEALITMFERYLTLADGNKAIALKFLNNAQSDAIDYPEVQELGE